MNLAIRDNFATDDSISHRCPTTHPPLRLHYPTAPSHYDVIKLNHFPRYWPFVRGIHRSPVNSLHKGQWPGALMFSLICAWIGWVNNGEADNLRRHRAHYDFTVMLRSRRCNSSSSKFASTAWYQDNSPRNTPHPRGHAPLISECFSTACAIFVLLPMPFIKFLYITRRWSSSLVHNSVMKESNLWFFFWLGII